MRADRAVALAAPPPQRQPAPRPRDRWLLMRLLAAGQSPPRLADRLIAEQGSLGSILSTSEERLRQLGTDANGIAMLGLVRETISAVLEREASDRPRLDNGAGLADAMHGAMAFLAVEQVRAAFLDAAQRLLRVEILTTGSVARAHVYPREIARRSLEVGAAGVILIHNHPSGDPTPSAEDIDLTARVRRALDAIDVRLVDHLVVARRGHVSFAEAGLL